MFMRSRWFAPKPWLLAIAAAFTLASPAFAQETFELSEQGFEQVQAPTPGTPEGDLHDIRQAIAAGETKQAIKLANAWIDANPNHPAMPEAFLLRGDAHVAQNDFYKALFDYEYLLRAYPGSPHFETALEREMKIAEAFGRGVKRKLWGMRILPAEGEAEELYIRIQERAPGSKVAERAGIELADFYYRRSEMASAAVAYELFLENYPQSQWREHAMQRQILANLATFKGPKFDATGLIEASNRLSDYKRSFPAAAEQLGAEALDTRIDETLATRDLLVAQWYDKRGEKVSAVFMYKRVIRDHPGSAAAARALQRLQELDPATFAATPVTGPDSPQTEPSGFAVPVPTPEGQPQPQPPAPSPQPPAPPAPMSHSRFIAVAVVSAVLASLAGCAGYSSQGLYDPNVRTVGVPIFQNRTFYREVEFQLTEALSKQLEQVTPYKVVSGGADTQITGTILNVEQRLLSRRIETGVPQEIQVVIVASYEWKDLRTGKILRKRSEVAASGEYVPTSPVGEPIEVARHAAVSELAEQIVLSMQADW